MTIVDAMRDPVLFVRFFGSELVGLGCRAQVFGIAMTEMELAFFGQLSARETGPGGNTENLTRNSPSEFSPRR